jgi:hypothetical protein
MLERFLATERDETVSFKILRALGHLRRHRLSPPENPELLLGLARRAVNRGITMSCARFVVDSARSHLPGADTPSAELLAAALFDQEERALSRAFRLMHVLEPTEDLEALYGAVRSPDPDVRARGRELVEHVAPEALRRAVLALVDDRSDDERVHEVTRFYMPPGFAKVPPLVSRLSTAPLSQRRELEQALRASLSDGTARLLEDESRVVRAIASYHAAELGAGPHEKLLGAAPALGRETLRQIAEGNVPNAR